MYIVGGVEVLLVGDKVYQSIRILSMREFLQMYIVPDMAIGGREALHDTDRRQICRAFNANVLLIQIFFFTALGPLYNNYRIYGTVFLLLQVLIVAMGVKFVQLLAPVGH